MTIEFHDTAENEMHDDFQQWRMDNPNGFILNYGKSCMLHTAECTRHFGDKEWSVHDFGRSLTNKTKVCATTILELRTQVDREKTPIAWCSHCTRELRLSVDSKE